MPSTLTPVSSTSNTSSIFDQPDTRTIRVGQPTRLLAIGALAGIAIVHLKDLPGKMSETPYLGMAYIGLIIGVLWSIVAIARHRAHGWWAAAGLAGATLVGFLLSRTIGLPAATDDIGNWGETLGVVAVIAEGAAIALAVKVLATRS